MPGTDIPLGKWQTWKSGEVIFKCKLIGLRGWVNKKQHPQVTREKKQPPTNSSTFRAVLWLCVRQDIPEALHNSQTLCQQFSHTGSLQTPWHPKSRVMLSASHTAPSSHKVTKKQTVQWGWKLDTAFCSWTRLLLVLPVHSTQPQF